MSNSSDEYDGGYISSAAIVAEQKAVRALGLTNLGGYMLYDAEDAVRNNNYQVALRNALP